jgi:hypothetical protein
MLPEYIDSAVTKMVHAAAQLLSHPSMSSSFPSSHSSPSPTTPSPHSFVGVPVELSAVVSVSGALASAAPSVDSLDDDDEEDDEPASPELLDEPASPELLAVRVVLVSGSVA